VTTGPRHEKAEMLLTLALRMQATRSGLSLADIQEALSISRRTAERLRDALWRVFPQMEEVPDEERTKRWRLPTGTLSRLLDCSSDQLIALQTASALLSKEGLQEQAGKLEQLRLSLLGAMRPDLLRRMEPDLEALTLAEGLALQPGPRRRLNNDILAALRHAILGMQEICIEYTARSSGKDSKQTIHPYGFLYGRKAYLVAYSPAMQDWRLWLLSNIRSAKKTGNAYQRDAAFSLQDYAARSFGVYQEEPQSVVLRFNAEAASDVLNFHFHPTQQIEQQNNGDIIVRFTAGGLSELCWHLFTWGDSVTILEPDSLLQTMRELCHSSLRNS